MADTLKVAFDEFMRLEAPHDYDARNEDALYIWKAAWAAALASRPAEVDDEGLPPLPYSDPELVKRYGPPTYTIEQFRQGQRDAVAADRARIDTVSDWKLVPFEPTPEMIEAFTDHLIGACGSFFEWFAGADEGYKAMIEAAPSHTTNKEK